MRSRHVLFFTFLMLVFVLLGIFFHARCLKSHWDYMSADNRILASMLGFSDLSLSTEGRYIRHLSLSDSFSPFQDTPCGFDLFPSGTFFGPPEHTGTPGGAVWPGVKK